MLTIRLSRVGKKKQPTYRFVIQEKGRDPWGKHLEILGHYNPRANPPSLILKADRVKYWLSQGAQASDTVHNLLIQEKVIEGEKRRIVSISRKRRIKMAEAAAKIEAAPPPATTAPEASAEPPPPEAS
jgi:small subunit ribosomal protein S16